MIITGIITSLAIFSMFYKSVSTYILSGICISIVAVMFFVKHEKGDSVLSIDIISRKNKLSDLSSGIKIILSLVLISLCVASKNPLTGFVVTILCFIILVGFGKIEFGKYIRLLSIPMAFIFIGGLAIAFNYSKNPMDIVSVRLFGGYLGIGTNTQLQTRLVVFKSFGAVSSLYIMSLTTPMSEIIRCLKKVHVPSIVIDLMYLIYRCIFIIYEMHGQMKIAAQSRGGYISYKKSLKTTAKIYSNLLFRSYLSSSKMFDAMMSRCYNGEIRFLRNKK